MVKMEVMVLSISMIYADSRGQSNRNDEKETSIGTRKFEENCSSKRRLLNQINYRNIRVDNDRTANYNVLQ